MTHNTVEDFRCAAQNPHAWQPVTPTSPPWDGVPILVWQSQQDIWISARFRDQDGYGCDWYLGQRRYPPTHWMPLPEPPYRESEDE